MQWRKETSRDGRRCACPTIGRLMRLSGIPGRQIEVATPRKHRSRYEQDMMKHLRSMAALTICCLGATTVSGQDAAAAKPQSPTYKITLGDRNVENGLRLASGGDGNTVAVTAGGTSARKVATPDSRYMYVAIDYPKTDATVQDYYAVVEAFDDSFGPVVRLEYNKDNPRPEKSARYTFSEQTLRLTGSGRMVRGVFYLQNLQLNHGENFGADFRLITGNVAIHSIQVTAQKPDDFDPAKPVDDATLKSMAVSRPPGMQLTFGNHTNPTNSAIFKALSGTAVESTVDWASVEPEENQWDWSEPDKYVAMLKAANLKWVPFLVLGSAYATPLWFQNGPHSHFYRSLETGEDTRVQSIFNPDLPPYVERFVNAFADRYRDSGVIESVILGVTGIYGESIYPAGGPGGWTTKLTGEYVKRKGWWAGDKYAVASFREAMQKAYPDIGALNAAWHTRYGSFGEVTPFIPDRAPDDRARLDFVQWYTQSMTHWAAFWGKATRKAFPETEIVMCTGGSGQPILGADLTAQAAALAPMHVGIRITNEGNDYLKNFTITREVATATHFYGTACGFEPAGPMDAPGITACIYNAISSGAKELFFYDANVLGSEANMKSFRASAPMIRLHHPAVDVALYLSRETWAMAENNFNASLNTSAALRPLVDHDFVTSRTVDDGILKNYRALVLADSPVLDPRAAAVIEQWVESGGILITVGNVNAIGNRLHDNASWRSRLLAPAAGAGKAVRVKNGYVVSLDALDRSPRAEEQLEAFLRNSPAQYAGQPLAPAMSGAVGAFVTRTREGTLWYTESPPKIGMR